MHLDEQAAAGSLALVEQAIDRIDGILTSLAAEVDNLERAWDGEAREAFRTAEREWHQSLTALRAAAASAATRATGAVQRFGDFDRRRAGAWAR
ncbi:WXG100 family type VII secretion target [Microbacterium sp. SL62]|uniref:WXG100 family type VII secretion target n=1 Tax=Microbacterium sp. SL62 TaxID=2995139 RepID=UPI002276006C|nr:WXG100 family type VII secretion target [Microbacterium sp. SL62]MCY1715539.1 WXG100 family type VII secretion target [Microbacterium sp. SL62]